MGGTLLIAAEAFPAVGFQHPMNPFPAFLISRGTLQLTLPPMTPLLYYYLR
jgi:hypothetical protein